MNTKKQNIDEKFVYELIKYCINFPFPQICRHLVALNILDKLEQYGYEIDDELCKQICANSAGDDKALENIDLKLKSLNGK